jgi:hypothetical protein
MIGPVRRVKDNDMPVIYKATRSDYSVIFTTDNCNSQPFHQYNGQPFSVYKELNFLVTFVFSLLACMAPKHIFHNIVLVQLKLVIELWVITFAFSEEGWLFPDVINRFFSNLSCPPASHSFN